MYEQNQIVIKAVSNGWVVSLPVFQPDNDMFEKQMVRGFQAVKNMLPGEDAMLNKIENDLLNEEPTNEVYKRDKNMHVFKTFKEVLAFLDFSIEE